MRLISSASFILEFAIRHLGTTLVLIGVGWEIILEWKHADGKSGRWKKVAWIILILGLILDFREAAESDKEVANLNLVAEQARKDAGNAIRQAGEANASAKKSEADRAMVAKDAEEIRSTNFVLQIELEAMKSNNIALEAKLRGIDPAVQPIVSITATAKFRFTTNDQAGYFRDGELRNQTPTMNLLSSNAGNGIILKMDTPPSFLKSVGNNFMPLDTATNLIKVYGHDVTKPDFLQCKIHFDWLPESRDMFEAEAALTNVHGLSVVNRAGDVANSDLMVTMETGFLQENTHILGGTVEIIFNNNPLTKRVLEMQPQDIHMIPSISIEPQMWRLPVPANLKK